MPATKGASLDIQRQEAFVAAFAVALGEIGEQLSKDDDRLFATKTVGDFQVTPGSPDSLLISNDEFTVEYKGQEIVVSTGVLKPPVRPADFPRWNDTATRVAGVEIVQKRDSVQTQGTFEVVLAYGSSAPAPAGQRLRVGENDQAANLVSQVKPVYPDLAKSARVEGVVLLEAEISAEGTVEKVNALTGDPLLIGAAVNAVKQWRYKPTLVNGKPVPIITTITLVFSLR